MLSGPAIERLDGKEVMDAGNWSVDLGARSRGGGLAFRAHIARAGVRLSTRTIAALVVAVAVLFAGTAQTAHADYIYWEAGRANLDGSGIDPNFRAQAADSNYIYWSTGTGIARAKQDGTGVRPNFLPAGAGASAIAVNATHIYWISGSTIGRATIDGKSVDPYVAGVNAPSYGLAVDNDHLYWVNFQQGVVRSNLDGTQVQGVVSTGNPFIPVGVAVNAKHVYWTNGGYVGRANLDGSSPNSTFISTGVGLGVALDAKHVYWGDYGKGISRANLDGTNVTPNFVPSAQAYNVAVRPAPSVSFQSPVGGSTGTSRLGPAVAVFDRAMDKSKAESAFTVRRSDNGEAVSGDLAWYGNALIFTPRAPFANQTSYYATVGTGAEDPAGNALVGPSTWQFTTATQPTIPVVVPADRSTEILPNAVVVVAFDAAMNKASAEGAFSLRRSAGGDPLKGTFGWYGNALIFKPKDSLQGDTQYTATVATSAKDSNGNPLPATKSWSFTTTNRPTVNYIYPADGSTGVLRSSVALGAFSKPMDKPSAEAAFALKKSGSGEQVKGAFGWYGNTLIFAPDAPLAANTQYVATIAGTARDLGGRTLANPTSWRFTTGSG